MLNTIQFAPLPSHFTPESVRLIYLDFITNKLTSLENVTPEILAESSSILSLLTQLNMKEEKLVLHEHLGDYYHSKCHYYDAFMQYVVALESRPLVFNDPHMIPIIKKLMSSCTPIGKFVDALHFANLSFIYMPNMSLEDFYSIKINSALAHSMLTSYDVALREIAQLLKKSPTFLSEHPRFHLNLLLLKSKCLLLSENFDACLETYKTIVASFDLSTEYYLLVLLGTSSLYLRSSRTTELLAMLPTLEHLLPYYESTESQAYIVEIYCDLGELYCSMDDFAQGESYYLQSLELSLACGHTLNTAKILDALVTMYSAMDNKKGMDILRPYLSKILPIQSLVYSPIISKMILFYNTVGDPSAITEILQLSLAITAP
ncbi:MAG: hypothetical protein ACRDDX_11490 [Cellulosilyticaceae bacterium]